MEVAATEAERGDRSSPGKVRVLNPRTGDLFDVKWGARFTQSVERLPDLDAGGLDLVVQRQHRLDQTSSACGRLGVPDLRFDRAECAAMRATSFSCIDLL